MYDRIHDVLRAGLQVRVCQQGSHDRPVGAVLIGDGQANAEVVMRVGEVEAVEPVAGVVAVPVKRLGTQHVIARMEERHPLTERDDAEADVVHAYPVGDGRLWRGLVLNRVEQRFVVMRGDVDDVFLWVERVTCGLSIIIHICPGYGVACRVSEGVVAQVARQPDPNLVGMEQQAG